MLYKRYQYWSKEGKKFTDWFIWNSTIKPKYQFNNKLINEYKEDYESICTDH